MKKLLCMLLVLLLTSVSALADGLPADWSAYTTEELEAAREAINEELSRRAAAVVAAAEPSAADDFAWASNGIEVHIRKYNGPGGDVLVPATIEGLPVTAIGEKAFAENVLVTSVVLPASVQKVDSNAFYGCSALQSVTFSGSDTGVLELGRQAFMNAGVASVALPQQLTKLVIRNQCFLMCKALTQPLVFDAAYVEIGDGAFWGCSGVPGVAVFADSAYLRTSFDNMSGLKWAYFSPEMNLTMRDGVFSNCKQLETVCLPDLCTGMAEKSFSADAAVTLYAREGAVSIDAARAAFMSANTAAYQQTADALLGELAARGVVIR